MCKRTLCLTVIFLLLPAALWAQVTGVLTPSATQERSRQNREYFERQRALRDKSEDKPEQLIEQLPPDQHPGPRRDDPNTFILREVHTSPSQILSSAEIKDITDTFIGREVSLAEIYKIVRALNALYRSKNAFTARAILPPQEISGGVVDIQLIEGRLGAVNIQGNASTRESFIRKRISLQNGDFVNLNKLEQDLLLFNAVYDAQIKALLKPGKEFGKTDFVLTVFEPNKYEGLVYADNTGRDESGKERGGFSVSRNSLFGLRDRLTVGGIFADGTAGLNVAYDIPISRLGTRLRVSYDRSDVSVERGALAALNIEGDSDVVAFLITHPFLVRKERQLSAFTGYNIKTSVTSVSGVEILNTDVRSALLGANYLQYDKNGYWYLQSVLTQGFDDFGGDREFLKFNGEFSRIHVLKQHVYLLIRTSVQLSDESFLPSSEQFQMGGLTTVRGYREGVLIGDAGYFINAELHFPILLKHNNKDIFHNRLNGFFFADQGATITVQDAEEDNTLVSAGVGFNVRINKYLNGRFVVGFPLKDDLRTDEKDARFHFYIQAQF